eukprot:1158760-Pelagomonas_calceolata.AAC.2
MHSKGSLDCGSETTPVLSDDRGCMAWLVRQHTLGRVRQQARTDNAQSTGSPSCARLGKLQQACVKGQARSNDFDTEVQPNNAH